MKLQCERIHDDLFKVQGLELACFSYQHHNSVQYKPFGSIALVGIFYTNREFLKYINKYGVIVLQLYFYCWYEMVIVVNLIIMTAEEQIMRVYTRQHTNFMDLSRLWIVPFLAATYIWNARYLYFHTDPVVNCIIVVQDTGIFRKQQAPLLWDVHLYICIIQIWPLSS